TVQLTTKLIKTIQENDNILQGLFPGSTGNQSIANGGSLRKSEYHWKLAQIVFENHP
ncbi:hypothetical protein BDN72DRAFT_804736, partial [Pluteus cervinus]